jgi:DNA-binding MarR family transcriptional regulator
MVSPLDAHLGYWLRMVSNQVSHAFRQKVEQRGVTVAEWVVLRRLFEHTAVNPSEVARELGMTRGAISKLIDRLVRKELVVRETSEIDRRFQSVQLTPAGRKLVPRLADLADKNDDEFFGSLTDKQRSVLRQTLERLVEHHGFQGAPTE